MANTKRKGLVIVAAIGVLAALAYIGYTLFGGKSDKDSKDDDPNKDVAENDVDNTNVVSNNVATAQNELATKYRIWANSTDALSKKYGKKSSFDLDEISTTPYNSFFIKSYAVGKADYEKSLIPAAKPIVFPDPKQQIINLSTRYKTSVRNHPKGQLFVQLNFKGTLNGSARDFKLDIYERNPANGKKMTDNFLVFIISDTTGFNYLNPLASYSWKFTLAGHIMYRQGKFYAKTTSGIGTGASSKDLKVLSKTVEKLSYNQIKILDLGDFKI